MAQVGPPGPDASTAPSRADLLREVELAKLNPSRRFGRYVILTTLGKGGMGSVFRAWDTVMARLVALKVVVIQPDTPPDSIERLYREARSAARLAHPGIVNIYDVGEHGGKPFIAMQIVDGETLTSKFKKRLPFDEVCAVCRDVARALHFAHSQGVVHRDVKPGNILIDRAGDAFLTDFGLVLDRENADKTNLTRVGETLGTPLYMAPEQAEGLRETIGPASDIWSLGAVLYWGACRRPPFNAPSTVELLIKVIADPVVPPRKIDPNVPEAIEAVILRCLQKAPADRFGTAAELADALDAYLGDRFPRRGSSRFKMRLSDSDRLRLEERASSGSGRSASGSGRSSSGSGRAASASSSGSSKRRRRPSGVSRASRSGRSSGSRVARGSGSAARRSDRALREAIDDRLETLAAEEAQTALEREAVRMRMQTVKRGAIGLVLFALVVVALAPTIAVAMRDAGSVDAAAGDDPGPGAGAGEAVVVTAPGDVTVTVAEPVDGTTTSEESVVVRGRVDGDGVDVIWVGPREARVREDGRFHATVALEREGTFQIPIRVAMFGDPVETVTVHVDRSPPRVSIIEPTEAAVLDAAPVRVVGQLEETTLERASVSLRRADGTMAARTPIAQAGRFSARLDASAESGPLAIIVVAVDRGGRETRFERSITVTAKARPIRVVAPENGYVTAADAVELWLEVADAGAGQTVLVDGERVTLGPDGRTSVRVALERDGPRDVELATVDARGRRREPVHHRVVRDATPPMLTVGIAEGAVVDGSPLSLAGRVVDDHPPRLLTVGDAEVPVDPDGRFVAEVHLREGENEVVFAALDALGNETRITRRVVLDAKSPVVTLDAGNPVFLARARVATIRGRVSKDGCRVKVAGKLARVTGDRFEAEVEIGGSSPVRRVEVEVVATDPIGNQGRASTTVTWSAFWPPKDTWWKPETSQLAHAEEAAWPLFLRARGMRFVLVPPGRFPVGAPEEGPSGPHDADGAEVILTRAFYLAATELTNAELRRIDPDWATAPFVGERLDGDDQPAGRVSFEKAIWLCEQLSAADPGHDYRLPTEAEWEWAARLGGSAERVWANEGREASKHANLWDGTARAALARRGDVGKEFVAEEDLHASAADAGTFAADALGLFDVIGNVAEWCADRFAPYPGGDDPRIDPRGPGAGEERVIRGGSWRSSTVDARAAARRGLPPDAVEPEQGVRIVCVPAWQR